MATHNKTQLLGKQEQVIRTTFIPCTVRRGLSVSTLSHHVIITFSSSGDKSVPAWLCRTFDVDFFPKGNAQPYLQSNAHTYNRTLCMCTSRGTAQLAIHQGYSHPVTRLVWWRHRPDTVAFSSLFKAHKDWLTLNLITVQLWELTVYNTWELVFFLNGKLIFLWAYS